MLHVITAARTFTGPVSNQGRVRGEIKEFLSLLCSAFQVCKVFPSVQLGMKRQKNVFPSKAHWSGSKKGTLKVIIKKSIQAFQVLLGSRVFLLSSSIYSFYQTFGKNAYWAAFMLCSSPGQYLNQESKLLS